MTTNSGLKYLAEGSPSAIDNYQSTVSGPVPEPDSDGASRPHQLSISAHGLQFPIAPATSTATTESPRRATIFPYFPTAIRSTAATPKRVASTRSYGEGDPPRCMWPNTLIRTSLLEMREIASPTRFPTGPPCAIFQLGRQFDALGDHNNREAAAAPLALRDKVAYAPHGERNFGNQNDVRPARDAPRQPDPPAIAPHHLDHHDAVCEAGRCRVGILSIWPFGPEMSCAQSVRDARLCPFSSVL